MPTDEELKAFLAGKNTQPVINNSVQQTQRSYITQVNDSKPLNIVQMTEGYNPYQSVQTFSNNKEQNNDEQ